MQPGCVGDPDLSIREDREPAASPDVGPSAPSHHAMGAFSRAKIHSEMLVVMIF